MSLYERVQPKHTLKDLVLSDDVTTTIKELLEDYAHLDALKEAGIPVRRKVLLSGPSGCGKTSLAHSLAHELKTDLYRVSLAETVGGVIGESEKHAESIFTFANTNRCVMLIDEFDSLASQRRQVVHGADQAGNRLVNSILTSMESKPPLGLIICCTNFLNAIDPAIRRRFDLELELPTASQDALLEIARNVLKGRFGISPQEVVEEASTPALVVRVAQKKLRGKVIELAKYKQKELLAQAEIERVRLEKARIEMDMAKEILPEAKEA